MTAPDPRTRWAPRLSTAVVPVRYVARYGAVLLAAVLVVVAEVSAGVQRGMAWRGDLIWTLDWIPVSFVLVGPVVAGLAALDTARTATGAGHLAGLRVPRTPSAAITWAYAVVIGLTHLAVLGVALVVSAPAVGDVAAPLAVACQLAILVFFAALGTLVGRFTGPVLAGVSAALVAFAAVYVLGTPTPWVSLLAVGGATLPRIGYAYNVAFLATQLVMLLLVVAAALVLRPAAGARLRVRRPDALVAAVLVAGAAALSVGVRTDRLVAVDARPTFCGAVQAVPTCFYPQHRRVAPAFQEQLWALVDGARAKGYPGLVPVRFEEASRTVLPQAVDPRVGAVYVLPDHLAGARPALRELVLGLVQPLHCPQLRGSAMPDDRYWQDLETLTATWVGLADDDADSAPFTPLDPAAATRLIEQFRTCTYPYF